MDSGSREENASNQNRQPIKSEIAGTNAANVVAVDVEPGGPAAAAIAVVVTVVRGGDGAADNRGADEAGSNAPAPTERLGLSLRAGGRHRAGNGKRGEGDSGNLGLDRHEKLHPFERRHRCGPHTPWTEPV